MTRFAVDALRPREERYARGEPSGEGYYRDSHDHARFRAARPGQRLYLDEVDPKSRADIVVAA